MTNGRDMKLDDKDNLITSDRDNMITSFLWCQLRYSVQVKLFTGNDTSIMEKMILMITVIMMTSFDDDNDVCENRNRNQQYSVLISSIIIISCVCMIIYDTTARIIVSKEKY